MFAQFDEREVEYHYVPWKHTEFDTCTRFMVQSILCRTFSCFKILMFQNLVLNMYEDDEFSRQMPGKKDYVSVAKRVHKQKLLALCNLEKCMLPSRKNILMLSLDFPNSTKVLCPCCVFRYSFCMCMQYPSKCNSVG